MRRYALSLVVALSVAALAGCGGGSSKPSKAPETGSKAPEATAPAPKPQTTVTIKVGGTDKVALKNLPVFLTGNAEAEGIKLDFQEYKGGSEVAKALLNGEVDMAILAADSVMKDKSGEFRMVSMVTNGPGQALVVDSQFKDTIKSVKDLVGQKVGVSSLGSGPHKTLTDLLTASGIDPKTVQVLPVGDNTQDDLGTGKVAAVVTIEPYITMAEQSGKGVVLVDARQSKGIQAIYGTPEVPWITLSTRADFIKSNPDAVQKMVSLIAKGLKFIASSSGDAIAQKSPDFFKAAVNNDSAVFNKMLDENKATFSKDGQFNQQSLDAYWKRLQAAGSVSKDAAFPFATMVDSSFLDKVK